MVVCDSLFLHVEWNHEDEVGAKDQLEATVKYGFGCVVKLGNELVPGGYWFLLLGAVRCLGFPSQHVTNVPWVCVSSPYELDLVAEIARCTFLWICGERH